MTDERAGDVEGADEFELLGRRAGAELRQPPPAEGPAAARSRARSRRMGTVVSSVVVVVLVVVGGLVFLQRDTDDDPVGSVPSTPTPTPSATTPLPKRVVLSGHDGLVVALDATIAGRDVATGGEDGTVRVWDSFTGVEVMRVDVASADPIDAVALSPDGTLVAAHQIDGTSSFWTVADGAVGSRFAVPWDDPHYFELLQSIRSPDGTTRVETGSFNGATLVDAGSGDALTSFPGTGRAYTAAWNSDGSLLAVKFDRKVKVWRLDTFDELQIIDFPDYAATAERMQFTSGDERLAFTVEDTVIIETVDRIDPVGSEGDT